MKNKQKTIHPAAKLIKDYCEANKVSMRALSQRIGASDKYVSDLVNGNSANPDHNHLRSLSEQTGIPFEQLSANDNKAPNRVQARPRQGWLAHRLQRHCSSYPFSN